MKRKTETIINDISLPEDVLKHISHSLTTKEANRWSMTHKGYYSLFRKTDFFLSRFLTCVARGAQNEAQSFLKINLTLMIQEGWVIDYSNRKFYTSAFKYILGALDSRYMFNMFMSCLREAESVPLQKKKEITLELLKQYQEFENEGITYTLDEVAYKNEQHFGFTPLLEALKTFVNSFNLWSEGDRNKFFSTEVGKAQILVPAHLAQHYCDPDVSFYPKPTFTTETFNRCLNVFDDKNAINQWWVHHEGKPILGLDTGYVGRDKLRRAPGARERVDLEAVTALFEIRMTDKLAIEPKLKGLVQEFDQALESQEQTVVQLKW